MMDRELFNRIYSILNIELGSGEKKYTHSEIEEAAIRCADFCKVSDKEIIRKLVNKFEESNANIIVNKPQILVKDKYAGQWFERKKVLLENGGKEGYFGRYEDYLRKNDFPENVIERIRIDNSKVLKLCANPDESLNKDDSKKKGLVVGDVQSGKTANYIGLINLACDYGYKIIVLLAGMTDSLRQQTQSRVDMGFIGAISDSISSEQIVYTGVGIKSQEYYGIPMTNNEYDFVKFIRKNKNFTTGDLIKPVVLIVKKNASVLRQIEKWLKPGSKYLNGQQQNILIIDDECDNASVNTSKDISKATKINGYICNLFNNFPIASYVGYTATPFANIFIKQDSDKYNNLFPSDFIVLLESPSNYFGPNKIFAFDNESKNSRFLRVLSESEPFSLPAKHKKGEAHFDKLPESLKEAILCFLIDNVIMTLRGKADKHRSMLINITVVNEIHDEIKEVVDDYLDLLRIVIKQDGLKETALFIKNEDMGMLYNIYNGEVQGYDFYKEARKEIPWELLKAGLLNEIEKIETSVFNNTNKKNRFSYSDKKYDYDGARIIAIGGMVLSRGLTLEGLMISYYNRSTSLYDALMQMGRWFGYRNGYEDLCRIYISQINIQCFRAVVEAVENLKAQFRDMSLKQKTPAEFGLMVLESPDSLNTELRRYKRSKLLATAKNKSRNSFEYTIQLNYGQEYADTSKLSTNELENEINIDVIHNFLSRLKIDLGKDIEKYYSPDQNSKTPKLMVKNVPNTYIADCIKELHILPDNTKFDTYNLSNYIYESSSYTTWNVLIASGSSNSRFFDENKDVERSFCIRPGEDVIRIGSDNNRLINPGDFGVGMTPEMLEKAKEYAKQMFNEGSRKNPDDLTAKDYLSVEDANPIFIIYPIRLKSNSEESLESIARVFSKGNPLLGFAVGFPLKEKSEKMKYLINEVKLKQLNSSNDDYCEEIDDND